MATDLEATTLVLDLFQKRDALRSLMGPEAWSARMKLLMPYIRARMVQDNEGAMSTALAFAVELDKDNKCPDDKLPFLFLCAGLELVSQDKCKP